MAPTRDTSVYNVKDTVTVEVKATGSTDEEAAQPKKRDCKARCDAIKCCLSVGPWVPLVAVLMVAVGLPFWVIYLRRALNYTTTLLDELFDERAAVLNQVTDVVNWTTLVSVCAVSSLMGLCLLVSFLRTFQRAAQLPTTRCSAPRKLSYGTYITLISFINFGMWLLAIASAAMISCTFVWIIFGLAAENLFETPTTTSSMAPATYYATANAAIDGLATTYPDMTATVAKPAHTDFRRFDNNVNSLVAADKQDPLRVCPSSCLSIGNLARLLDVSVSCFCDTAEFPHYKDTARDIWKSLLYVIGGLALQGLAALWLLMNLSANYAHARRDMLESPTRADPWDMDPNADAYTAPMTAYVSRDDYMRSQKKTFPAATRQQSQDINRGQDTAAKSLPPIRNDMNTSLLRPAATSEAVVPPPPELAQAPSMAATQSYTFNYPSADTSAEEATSPTNRGTPSPRANNSNSETQPLEPSPSSTLGRAYNSTAQRYAAYRLRTASAKSSPSQSEAEGRRKWVR